MNLKRVVVTAQLVCLLAITPSTFAGGKAKGGSGGGGTTSPITYRVQFFDTPYAVTGFTIFDNNDSHQAVGYWADPGGTNRAFLYDYHLNATTAIDLNTIVSGIPAGMLIRRATAINHLGDIAVYLTDPSDLNTNFQAGVVDMSQTPPQLLLLSDEEILAVAPDYDGRWAITMDMNDIGDVLIKFRKTDSTFGVLLYNFGVTDPALKWAEPVELGFSPKGDMRINNPSSKSEAMIAGRFDDGSFDGMPFTYTLGQGLMPIEPELNEATGDVYKLIYAMDINNSGQVIGEGILTKARGGKATPAGFIWNGTYSKTTQHGIRLNDSADFVSHTGWLVHSDAGDIDPVQSLDPNDPATSLLQTTLVSGNLRSIANRDETGFPVFFGDADYDMNGVIVHRGNMFVPVPQQQ